MRDHIRLALGDNGFGLFGVDDHADGANWQPGFPAHTLGNRNIEAGFSWASGLSGVILAEEIST